MKYWGYFAAKLALAFTLLWAVGAGLRMCFPSSTYVLWSRLDLFAYDLPFTAASMLYFLFCVGVLYLVVWDQRYRCRTCLRRLRMPVTAGSWPNMFLKGQPRTEYICIYGHGTLKVPEVELTGAKSANWEPHSDIWKELESLETGQR